MAMVMVAAVLLMVLMMKMTTTMMMFSMITKMIRLSTHHNNETTGAGEGYHHRPTPQGGEGGIPWVGGGGGGCGSPASHMLVGCPYPNGKTPKLKPKTPTTIRIFNPNGNYHSDSKPVVSCPQEMARRSPYLRNLLRPSCVLMTSAIGPYP